MLHHSGSLCVADESWIYLHVFAFHEKLSRYRLLIALLFIRHISRGKHVGIEPCLVL